MKKIEIIFLGIIAGFVSLVLIAAATIVAQLLFSGRIEYPDIYFYAPSFIFLAVVIEELTKYFFLRKALLIAAAPKAVLQNAILFGCGFALAEIMPMLFTNQIQLPVFRNLLEIATLHIITSLLIASVLKHNTLSRGLSMFFALLPALFFHLSYNFAILWEKDLLATLSVLLPGILLLTLSIIGQLKKRLA